MHFQNVTYINVSYIGNHKYQLCCINWETPALIMYYHNIHIALQNLLHAQYSSKDVPHLLSASLHYFYIYYNFYHYSHTQGVY